MKEKASREGLARLRMGFCLQPEQRALGGGAGNRGQIREVFVPMAAHAANC